MASEPGTPVKRGLVITSGPAYGKTFDSLREMISQLGPNCEIKIVTIEMHALEKTIATLRAEIAELKVKLDKQDQAFVVAGMGVDQLKARLENQAFLLSENAKELETARRVREKLTEQRNEALNYATDFYGTDAVDDIVIADDEIAAIERKDGTK